MNPSDDDDRTSTCSNSNDDIELQDIIEATAIAIDNWKPLHTAAAFSRDGSVFESLLKRANLDINETTARGETALLLACKLNRDAKIAVTSLLRHKANPNIWDNYMDTPILAATRRNEAYIVNLLLLVDADVNIPNLKGWSPLHEAATSNAKVYILKRLLLAEAKIDCKDRNNLTPLTIAVENGQLECLRELLKTVEFRGRQDLVNLRGEDDATLLILATKLGFTECVKTLLDHGADPSLTTKDETTALHAAIEGGQATCECLKLLLKAVFSSDNLKIKCWVQGISSQLVNEKNSLYGSALSCAIEFGNASAVQLLLSAGANPNVPCDKIVNPLTLSLKFSNPTIFELLLEHGSDVNFCYRHNCGQNILLVALSSPHWRTYVPRLLLAGCDLRDFFKDQKVALFIEVSLKCHMGRPICAWQLMWLLHFVTVNEYVQKFFHSMEEKSKSYRAHVPHVWKDINVIVGQPSSLQHICRMKIRHELSAYRGSNFRQAMHTLRVPPVILNYLLFDPMCSEKYADPPPDSQIVPFGSWRRQACYRRIRPLFNFHRREQHTDAEYSTSDVDSLDSIISFPPRNLFSNFILNEENTLPNVRQSIQYHCIW